MCGFSISSSGRVHGWGFCRQFLILLLRLLVLAPIRGPLAQCTRHTPETSPPRGNGWFLPITGGSDRRGEGWHLFLPYLLDDACTDEGPQGTGGAEAGEAPPVGAERVDCGL